MEKIQQDDGSNINIFNNFSNNNNNAILNNFPKINNNNSSKNLMGVFKVKKLAKRGWTTNERILVVTEQNIAYYNYPSKSSSSKVFLDQLAKIYNPKKPQSSYGGMAEEEKDFMKLCLEFDRLPGKESLKKDEIVFELAESSNDADAQNPKKFACLVQIKEKKSEGSNRKDPNIYSKLKDAPSEAKGNVEKNGKIWIFDFIENNYFDHYKTLVSEIKKTKAGNIIREPLIVKPPIEQLKPQKLKIIDEPTIVSNKKNENLEVDPEYVQLLFYNEICYQYLLRQYFLVNALPERAIQKMKYEFAILQLTTKFKEICQTLVKRIVSDLYAKPFQQQQASSSFILYPIVFPYPRALKKPEQAVFLYNIGGINFTLTWHQTSFKMKNDKNEYEKTPLHGAWYHLKNDFKNRDFFQDLMIKLGNDFHNKSEVPRHPLSCLIDYCGFRVLCESDIYIDDGGAACGFKKFDQMNNNPEKDDQFNAYKEIANILSSEKGNSNFANSNNNINNINISINKAEKEQVHSNPEILISVPYKTKDKRDQHSKFSFAQVIKYHAKSFKEVNTSIFDNNFILEVLNENSKDLNIQTSNFNPNDLDGSVYEKRDGIKETHTGMMNNMMNTFDFTGEQKIHKDKLNEFFDLIKQNNSSNTQSGPLINLKETFKENIRYIMDPKVLIEIKEKGFENINSIKKDGSNKESSGGSYGRRNIYFRPEFLVKYLQENGFFDKDKNDKEGDLQDAFIKNLKKYLFVEGDPNAPNIYQTTKEFKENHINYFINCLDTLYFKPYDSETLTDAFHQYGINMFYLGRIAEDTSVPHVRELCLIEMIGRVCKKLIFDTISQKIIERANEDYYMLSNELGKKNVEHDYQPNSSEPYLQYLPCSFFIKYWKDYLKKLHILGSDQYKCTYNEDNNNKDKTSRGLYRRFWWKCAQSKDTDIKTFFQPPSKTNEKNNEKIMLGESNKEIVKFLNVLFSFKDLHDVEINGEKYRHATLWALIFKRVKSHYMIDNKEIFTYCDPYYISLPALFNSIQHHTGIIVNLPLINNTRFSNKDLYDRVFTEEMILEIKTKTSVYGYRYFSVNKNKNETCRNDYSLAFDADLYKKVLLRYYTEKFQKIVSTYTWSYLHYLNILKRMDSRNLGELDPVVESIRINDFDMKLQIKTDVEYYEFFKSQYTALSLKFESYNYLFLKIIEQFVNFAKEDSMLMQNTTGNLSSNKNNMVANVSEDCASANSYITEFWFAKHPFLCLLNILIARLNLKSMKSVIYDEHTEEYYKNALEIAKDSLGTNNIFVANLCEEIGLYYLKLKKPNYYEGTRHLIQAYNVFREHKEEFFECYMKNLKKLTKYFTILGYYKEAAHYGSELVTNYITYLNVAKTLEKFSINIILLNLINISKVLGNYAKGVEFCKILLYELQGNKPPLEFMVLKFKDWRYHLNGGKKKKSGISNTNVVSVGKTVDKKLINIIKVYLKLSIKNLKDSERLVYIQAYVKLLEDKKEREQLESMTSDPESLFKKLFEEIRDECEFSKYFSRILEVIGSKYNLEKSYQKTNELVLNEIDKNYAEMWDKFRTLYKIYSKNKVFTSFIDVDAYR